MTSPMLCEMLCFITNEEKPSRVSEVSCERNMTTFKNKYKSYQVKTNYFLILQDYKFTFIGTADHFRVKIDRKGSHEEK
jgi:hypothetical protein